MLPDYRRKSNRYIAIGLGLQVAWAAIVLTKHPTFLGLRSIVGLTSVVFFVHGCGMYLLAKGHSWLWSFLGLCGLPGLAILLGFSDRHPRPNMIRPTLRRRMRGVLWGGSIGFGLVAVLGILLLLFGERVPGSEPEPWYVPLQILGGLGVFLGLLGAALGLLVQGIVAIIRGDQPTGT